MAIEDDIALLRSVPTLGVLGEEALRILAFGAETRHLEGGDILFREGEGADAAYVIQSGGFKLTAQGQDAGTADAGSLLGEVALLAPTRRHVGATAAERASVLRLPRSLFLRMLDGYPDAADRLREQIADRLADAENEIERVRDALARLGAGPRAG